MARWKTADGTVKSLQIECRLCGEHKTGQYLVGQEMLAEAEWTRINRPGEKNTLEQLKKMRGSPVAVLVICGTAAASIPGLLDLESGEDGYEVQHGAAICRFKSNSVTRIEDRRIYVG